MRGIDPVESNGVSPSDSAKSGLVVAPSIGGVARGGAINIVGAGTGAIVGFALAIVITRGLPQGVAGVFFTTTSTFLVAVAVAQLGTNTGLVYFGSRARALNQNEMVPTYVWTAAAPVMVWSAALAVGMFVSAPWLGPFLNPDAGVLATTALRLLAPFLVAAAIENLAVSTTRGLGTMRPTALVTMIFRPATQVGLVAAALAVAGPRAAIVAWSCGYVASAIMGCFWLRRLLGPGVLRASVGPRPYREFWRFTAPRAVMTVAQISMQRLDIILVGVLAGAVPAAVYTAATRFVVAGQMGTQAVSLAAQPRFAHQIAVGDRAGVGVLYGISNAWLVLLTWPLYLVIATFSVTVMRVFGSGYSGGGQVIVVLAAALMVASLLGMVDVVLEMSGHTTWTLVNTLVALATQIGLDIWLIPNHGVLGAALGWAGGIVVRKGLAVVQAIVFLRLRILGAPTLIACALCGLGVGLPTLVAKTIGGDDFSALLYGLTISAICYLLGAYLLRRPLHLQEFVGALRSRSARAVTPSR